jgi:hypothetical protein
MRQALRGVLRAERDRNTDPDRSGRMDTVGARTKRLTQRAQKTVSAESAAKAESVITRTPRRKGTKKREQVERTG